MVAWPVVLVVHIVEWRGVGVAGVVGPGGDRSKVALGVVREDTAEGFSGGWGEEYLRNRRDASGIGVVRRGYG